MRVLYLTNNPYRLSRCSTTVPTEGWIRFLRPRGLEPVLVSQHIGASHWTAGQGIPVYEIPLPVPSKMNPWRFLWSLSRLRRVVRRHGIQLIHCNEQEIYPIGQYLARLCDLPVVVSVHFTMARAFCEWAFAGARRPRRIFFISGGNRKACREGIVGIVPESDWRVLYNGLDLDYFRPDEEQRSQFRERHGLNSELLIGTACALRPRKQLEQLFESAARLPMPRLRVIVAGSAVAEDAAYAQKLLKDGRDLLGDRLVYVGHLDELRGLYNALDLFVNTSREEACSISVLESLACGCPVVGYPSKSVDEQVLPTGGEIVEQDRIDQLTAALDRRLSDPAQLSEARKGARQRAEECFDIRKLADQLWQEYQSLVQEAE